MNGAGAERRRRRTRRVPVARAGAERSSARRGQRGDQRIARIGQRPGEQLDVLVRNAVAGDADEHAASLSTARQTERLHAGVARQPFEAGLGAARQVLVLDEVVLEQLEPRRSD